MRVAVNPVDHPHTEYLTYGFDEREPKKTTAYLAWESKRVPFTIEVPNINDLYLTEIRSELRNSQGFTSQNWMSAAQFCVNNKVNLEEALLWAENAVSLPFIGNENFNTLRTKADVLTALVLCHA